MPNESNYKTPRSCEVSFSQNWRNSEYIRNEQNIQNYIDLFPIAFGYFETLCISMILVIQLKISN